MARGAEDARARKRAKVEEREEKAEDEEDEEDEDAEGEGEGEDQASDASDASDEEGGETVYVVSYASWEVSEGGEGADEEPELEVVGVFRDLERANRAAEDVLRVTKFGDDTDWEDFRSEWGEEGMAVCEGQLRVGKDGVPNVLQFHRAWVEASELV